MSSTVKGARADRESTAKDECCLTKMSFHRGGIKCCLA